MILVSIISYKERDLLGTVKDCWEKAKNKNDLYFSIVEEHYPEKYVDLSFIPENQIRYEKYDLSKYRGILWARNRTVEIDVEYDYILYICGHTRFVAGWDQNTIIEYNKAKIKSETGKTVLTFCPSEFKYNLDWSINTKDVERKYILYSPRLDYSWNPKNDIVESYTPGYWFPNGMPVPSNLDVVENYWIHFTWCFSEPDFVKEVPLDPDMNFNGEEPYVTVQAWCRGWRMFATPVPLGYHHLTRMYPDSPFPKHWTDSTYTDDKKYDHWKNSDESMIKLNLLLSGNLKGKYGDITKEQVLEFCKASGLNEKWTEYNPNYDKIDGYQHMMGSWPK